MENVTQLVNDFGSQVLIDPITGSFRMTEFLNSLAFAFFIALVISYVVERIFINKNCFAKSYEIRILNSISRLEFQVYFAVVGLFMIRNLMVTGEMTYLILTIGSIIGLTVFAVLTHMYAIDTIKLKKSSKGKWITK